MSAEAETITAPSVTDQMAAARARARLARRLRPVYVQALLQNVVLWVPIEKLFMTEIGFDNGSVAVSAGVLGGRTPPRGAVGHPR